MSLCFQLQDIYKGVLWTLEKNKTYVYTDKIRKERNDSYLAYTGKKQTKIKQLRHKSVNLKKLKPGRSKGNAFYQTLQKVRWESGVKPVKRDGQPPQISSQMGNIENTGWKIQTPSQKDWNDL